MKRSRQYFETAYTSKEGVVLVKSEGTRPNVVEVWCDAYLASNKKIKQPKLSGFYFEAELLPLN